MSDRLRRQVVIIQPQIPHYRKPVFERLGRLLPWPVTILHGIAEATDSLVDCALSDDVTTRPIPWSRIRRGARQLSVRAIITPLLRSRPQVVVMTANMNYIAAHLLLMICRWQRIPLVGWSQLKRAGYNRRTLPLKVAWLRQFPHRILYTNRERREAIVAGMPAATTWSMNNGLRRPVEDPSHPDADDGPFIFCARLEDKNRADLLIAAFATYRRAGGQRQLTIIGDGSKRPQLEARATDLDCATGITWVGACYEEATIVAHMASARAMVHPFGIGLSIVTALMSGCPVICCRDPWEHMPEFWLWRDRLTGLGFDRGPTETETIAALAAAMADCDALDGQAYRHMRRACFAVTVEADADSMADRMTVPICRAGNTR